NDPKPMLELVTGKASERKLRLFACACCRETWAALSDERFKIAIEATEQFADGHITADALKSSHLAASDATESLRLDASEQPWHYVRECAAVAVFQACRYDLNHSLLMEVIRYSTTSSAFP